MWQPSTDECRAELEEIMFWGTLSFNVQADNVMRLVLQASGALKEIERLTALLDASTETNKTLNAENRNLLNSYDSGYRAA